jgi:hypothetical protein
MPGPAVLGLVFALPTSTRGKEKNDRISRINLLSASLLLLDVLTDLALCLRSEQSKISTTLINLNTAWLLIFSRSFSHTLSSAL